MADDPQTEEERQWGLLELAGYGPFPGAWAVKTVAKVPRAILPVSMGGGYLHSTAPWKYVPNLRAGPLDRGMLEVSKDMREMMARTGGAEVEGRRARCIGSNKLNLTR